MAESIHNRAVDLIGEEAVLRLRAHGFEVCEPAALDRFLDEHRKSNARIREAAAATMRACEMMTARTEIEITAHGPRLVVTFPIGDEMAFARMVAEHLSDLWDAPEGTRVAHEKTTDTNNVEVRSTDPDQP